MLVILTYFKPSGKYYSSGEFAVNSDTSLIDIWHLVEEKIAHRKLPGLMEGASDFIVLVNVPGHPYDHPKLFNIKESIRMWEV